MQKIIPRKERGFIGLAFDAEKRYKKQVFLVFERLNFLKFKYPKVLLFVLCIIAAYYFFSNDYLSWIISHLGVMSYAGVFICGLLFSFGFTTPFAIAILLKLNFENIFLAAIIGGLGALISDLIIFRFVKFSFEDEFRKIKGERPFLFLKNGVQKVFPPKLTHYLLLAFAGILFASPLPDEAAILILASLSEINEKKLAIISYICNTLGILIILMI
ncbi:MAG: hypothetical protein WC462_02445 [archaeon]